MPLLPKSFHMKKKKICFRCGKKIREKLIVYTRYRAEDGEKGCAYFCNLHLPRTPDAEWPNPGDFQKKGLNFVYPVKKGEIK